MIDSLFPGLSHDFVAPDSGPHKTAYACTFHWFQAPDGRTIGMDVIRSEDTQQLGLRVFVAGPDGALRALLHEAPMAEWQPFATRERPVLNGKNVLGRGTNWIAGSVRVDPAGPAARSIRSVEFELDLTVLPPREGAGPVVLEEVEHTAADALREVQHAADGVLKLTASDSIRVHTRGHITIDGERIPIDAHGPASIHYGEKLPEYAYLVTVPPPGADSPARPGILISSIHGDDLRHGGRLLGDKAVTYAYGSGGLPDVALTLGRFGPDLSRCPLGEGMVIEVSDVVSCPHRLLGLPTQTASASASLVWPAPGPWPWQWLAKKRVSLGRVMLDLRGDYYTRTLNGNGHS